MGVGWILQRDEAIPFVVLSEVPYSGSKTRSWQTDARSPRNAILPVAVFVSNAWSLSWVPSYISGETPAAMESWSTSLSLSLLSLKAMSAYARLHMRFTRILLSKPKNCKPGPTRITYRLAIPSLAIFRLAPFGRYLSNFACRVFSLSYNLP